MTEAKEAAFVCMSECKGALLRQLRLRAAAAVARSLRHSYEGFRGQALTRSRRES